MPDTQIRLGGHDTGTWVRVIDLGDGTYALAMRDTEAHDKLDTCISLLNDIKVKLNAGINVSLL